MLAHFKKRLQELPRGLKTRFAPSPTGYLHLGHVASALFVWGVAQVIDADVLLRIEDHDRQRSRDSFARALLEDLHWLGFIAKDAPYSQQSLHPERYQQGLAALKRTSSVYACTCSRSEISRRFPQSSSELVYDGHCRQRAESESFEHGLRVVLATKEFRFDDLWQGEQVQNPSLQCGDLLLRERSGSWTYNYCVAVDDRSEEIDLVVRGVDILDATARQLQLAELLGSGGPRFFLHHPLIVDSRGQKLSKRDGATGLRELREAGLGPEDVLGLAAARLGFSKQPIAVGELGRFFS